MASLNELINLSQYKSGAMGREGLPVIRRDTQQEQMKQSLVIQTLAAEVKRRNEEAAIAKKQRELWDSIGSVEGADKTTRGISTAVVDDEEAGGRDVDVVDSPSYEIDNASDSFRNRYVGRVSASGRMTLALPKEKKAKAYDKVKVVDRAMKLIDGDLATEGISKSTMKASDYSARLKQMIPQAEIDLYGEATTQAPAAPSYTSEDNRPVNPTGLTSAPEDFMPEYKEKRGMIKVAKDFYFGAKDKQGASGGKVMIQTPDGKRGYIPQANLQKALQRGARLVQ